MYNSPTDTLFIGKLLIYLTECHSTNTVALQLLQQEDLPEGAVIITDNQTAGRGQRGNSWEATPNQNLTFSMVLRPHFLSIQDQFLLTISISLAIYDFLTDLQVSDVAIKWPNDLYVGSKKLGGILIENSLKNAQMEWSVIGIGINVNQNKFTTATATSLVQLKGSEFTRQQVFDKLLKALEVRYLQLRKGDGPALRKTYLECMYWLGEWHLFESDNVQFTGKIVGIDPHGRLAILTQLHEHIKYYNMQQIRYVI